MEGLMHMTEKWKVEYFTLSPSGRTSWRSFGVHPPTPGSAGALASALNVPAHVADQIIDDLVAASLIKLAEPGGGWIMGDRVWEHAKDLPDSGNPTDAFM